MSSGPDFGAKFLDSFRPGDKVYGLAGAAGIGRNRYILTTAFQSVYGNLDFTTDQLNNRLLGTGVVGDQLDGPSIYFSNLMYGVQLPDMTPAQTEETDNFRIFLETHSKRKYRPSRNWRGPERNVRVGRACKAALEFNALLMGRRMHFMLDDIDLIAVMSKNPTPSGNKSITGQELRFLYRSMMMLEFNAEYGKWLREMRAQLRKRKRPDPPHQAAQASVPSPAELAEIEERKEIRQVGQRQSTSRSQMLQPSAVQLSFSIAKSNHVLANVIFWCGGEPTVPPWDAGLIRDVWYSDYGRALEKRNFMSKEQATRAAKYSEINRERDRRRRAGVDTDSDEDDPDTGSQNLRGNNDQRKQKKAKGRRAQLMNLARRKERERRQLAAKSTHQEPGQGTKTEPMDLD